MRTAIHPRGALLLTLTLALCGACNTMASGQADAEVAVELILDKMP